MAAKGKHGLGMGMSALFGETESAPAEENLPVTTLPLSRVEPRQDQPRTEFDEEALRQLADSIREYGLIQPTEPGWELGRYLLHRHDVLHRFFCRLNHSDDQLEQVERVEHYMSRESVHNLERWLDETAEKG